MSMTFTRFAMRETAAIALFNAGMNAAYTFWLWRRMSPIRLADIASDLAGTPVFIAVLSTLLGTAALRKKFASGQVERPSFAAGPRLLPHGILARATLFGTFAAIFLTLPLLTALAGLPDMPLTLGAAVTAKVAITLIFSALIVPIGIIAAASDGRRPTSILI